ncbi:MAG: hypothetical protein AAF985_07700 [Bacteroidota bacterium]
MKIVEVNNEKLKKKFIDFPHDLYAEDPNYVPEIHLAQKELMSPQKNPFFQHSKVQLYLAMRDQKIVGRIAAIRNNNYNEYIETNVGFFGFFDVVEDYDVAKALLDQAADWIKAEHLDAMIGPTNFTTNDTAGLLVDGFNEPPTVMMPYNKAYYATFLDRYGLRKKTDLLAYVVTEDKVSMKSVKLAGMLEERLKRKGIHIRSVNMKKFKEEVLKIKEVYNLAWEKNWGFVPATDDEFAHLADGLKMVIDPDFALIAEKDGKMIGFALAVPDINQVMRTVKRGRLLPLGIFKLLFGKKNIKKIRIITLGVIEEHRKSGIEGIFYGRIISNGLKKGINTAEASWILEDNVMMNKGVQNINMEAYKRYRIYEMSLSA